VERAEVCLHPSGAPKGFGTVRLEDAASLHRAVAALNGAILLGQALVVREDRRV